MADQESTLEELFCDSAKLHPHHTAVRYDDGNSVEQFTYKELAERSAEIASCLQGELIRANEIVGIYCRQFVGLPACILGVLHAGSAFAPVDIQWPPKLVAEFLTKLRIRLILVDVELASIFHKVLASLQYWRMEYGHNFIDKPELLQFGLCMVKVDAHSEVPKMISDGGVSTSSPFQFAYVMQTSGTTGGPKTVKVPHRCIVPNIISLRHIFKMTPEDVVLLASPYTFDPSVVQMFLALSCGAVLVIVPDALKMMPSKLCNVVFKRQKVTVLQPTSSLLYSCGTELIRSKVLSTHTPLRVLAFGGEVCPPLTTLRQWKRVRCKTNLYNLYGITEVSSWATCHCISEQELQSSENGECTASVTLRNGKTFLSEQTMHSVPLGAPLLDTVVEVRDEGGTVVTEGKGQVFIGGKQRVCLLEGETSVNEGIFRASGDWAYIKDGTIWYCGRTDRLIKRHGKQLNLTWLEHVISRTANDAQCCVVLQDTLGDTYGSAHQLLHAFVLFSGAGLSEAGTFKQLDKELKQLLPRYARPDSLRLVTSFPVTTHGKVDMKAILRHLSKDIHTEGRTDARQMLGYYWTRSLHGSPTEELEVTSLHKAEDKDYESSPHEPSMESADIYECIQNDPGKTSYCVENSEEFITNGGTSLQAVSLANQIEGWVNGRLPSQHHMVLTALVDVILNKTFGDLIDYVSRKLSNPVEEHEKSNKPVDIPASNSPLLTAVKDMEDEEKGLLREKPRTDISTPEVSDKAGTHPQENTKTRLCPKSVQDLSFTQMDAQEHKKLKVSHFVDTDVYFTNCYCSVRRGVQKTLCKPCKESKQNSDIQTNRKDPISVDFTVSVSFLSKRLWRTSLFKCIDASPLVVWSCKRGSEGEVFIGSHAHVFMAVRLSDGSVIWQATLGDRVESSAVLSDCGTFIIVGSYDGKVYFLKRDTGSIAWSFNTGGPVKSSPCVDTRTGLVWVGSHDHHLYALDPSKKQCACAVDCKSGSCFSSPVVSHEPAHLVYAATLGGRLLAVDPDRGSVTWSHQFPKPVFASPAVIPNGVICACADATVRCFDVTGRKLWTFLTQQPVFSSPVYYCDNSVAGCVLVGCHDKNFYCLTSDGELKWSFAADSQIYSTPFIASLPRTHEAEARNTDNNPLLPGPLVFVFSTLGTMFVLDLSSGLVVSGPASLPSEVFSSPVVVSNRVLIGCRDDYLYCIELVRTGNM